MVYVVAAAGIYLTISLIVLGKKRSDYSHIRQTISELGEHGCAIERQVAFGCFLPFGVAMAVVAIAVRENEPAALLAGAMAVGYVGAAFFPIDPGAASSTSMRNVLHWIAAIVEYVGAIAAFDIASRRFGFPFGEAKLVLAASLLVTYIPGLWNLRGLLQRIAEVVMLIGLGMLIWTE